VAALVLVLLLLLLLLPLLPAVTAAVAAAIVALVARKEPVAARVVEVYPREVMIASIRRLYLRYRRCSVVWRPM
jgi:hypothetical protein